MLIDKRRFNYVTYLSIERITQFLKETLEEYGFTVRVRTSDSSESLYLHVFCFHQLFREIRISNHSPAAKTDHDICASFRRPGAVNCHEFLIHFLDSLNLPHPEQTMNYTYVDDILNGLKSGKIRLGFSKNIIIKANGSPTITVTKRAN